MPCLALPCLPALPYCRASLPPSCPALELNCHRDTAWDSARPRAGQSFLLPCPSLEPLSSLSPTPTYLHSMFTHPPLSTISADRFHALASRNTWDAACAISRPIQVHTLQYYYLSAVAKTRQPRLVSSLLSSSPLVASQYSYSR